MVAQVITVRKLGDVVTEEMLDTQRAHAHLSIFIKVNMLTVTTHMNSWNNLHQMHQLAHLIYEQIMLETLYRKAQMSTFLMLC